MILYRPTLAGGLNAGHVEGVPIALGWNTLDTSTGGQQSSASPDTGLPLFVQ